MRIAIIGAGIAGVSTAYELAADGHAVSVLERHSRIAAEGSFAPPGVFGAGWWAVAPLAEGRSLPFGTQLLRTPGALPWWWQQRGTARPARALQRLETCARLALRSAERMRSHSTRLGIEFEQGEGALVLWRSDRERAAAQPAVAALRALDVVARDVDADQCPGIEPGLVERRRQIVELAAKYRLPGMYEERELVEAGGLMSYGSHVPTLWRRVATYVDKILKGAKPADLPLEEPTRYELFINLTTAKALRLNIPPSLLNRADEVFQ